MKSKNSTVVRIFFFFSRWCEFSVLVHEYPHLLVSRLFEPQHSVVDLPGESVLDVGEAGGSQ